MPIKPSIPLLVPRAVALAGLAALAACDDAEGGGGGPASTMSAPVGVVAEPEPPPDTGGYTTVGTEPAETGGSGAT